LQLEKIVQRLEGIQPENQESTSVKPNLQKWGKGSVRSYGTINEPNQVTRIVINLQAVYDQAARHYQATGYAQAGHAQAAGHYHATGYAQAGHAQAGHAQAGHAQTSGHYQAADHYQAAGYTQAGHEQTADHNQAAGHAQTAGHAQATDHAQATSHAQAGSIMINNQDVGAALQEGQVVSSQRKCCYILGILTLYSIIGLFVGLPYIIRDYIN
jgi:hypothetical protein